MLRRKNNVFVALNNWTGKATRYMRRADGKLVVTDQAEYVEESLDPDDVEDFRRDPKRQYGTVGPEVPLLPPPAFPKDHIPEGAA